MLKQTKARTVAYLGMMSGLVFIMLLIETYFFAGILAMPAAILTIPFSIALCIIGSKNNMLVGGTILGVSSFILSFIVGIIPFQNPLISILPRVVMGIIAYGGFAVVKLLVKNSNNQYIKDRLPLSIAGALGVLANTILVLTAFYLFDFSGITEVFTTIITFNFLLEFIAGIVLVPIFVTTINKIYRG